MRTHLLDVAEKAEVEVLAALFQEYDFQVADDVGAVGVEVFVLVVSKDPVSSRH
jgi:hypothetical protein